MLSANHTEAAIILNHKKLLGFRNLAETAPFDGDFEESADCLFQKRGSERPPAQPA